MRLAGRKRAALATVAGTLGLWALQKIWALFIKPEVYRGALGRVSAAGSPAWREPWRAPAVEVGIEGRDRAILLAGSTYSPHHPRPRPADPDHARRPPRRRRAAAHPHHLHRAAARCRDHPRR